MNNYNVKAEWTGGYPNLCRGEWIILVDGIKLSGIGSDHFDTYGDFESWSFDDNWSECFESYTSGAFFHEWKQNHPNGLIESLIRHGMNINDELLESIYKAVSEHDWRNSSCGGCI